MDWFLSIHAVDERSLTFPHLSTLIHDMVTGHKTLKQKIYTLVKKSSSSKKPTYLNEYVKTFQLQLQTKYKILCFYCV